MSVACETRDPLTLVYEHIWDIIEDFDAFDDMIKIGNRIKLNKNPRDPFKEVVQGADLPELILFPVGATPNTNANSSEATYTWDLQFLLSTGDKRVNELHFPIQWYIFRVIAVKGCARSVEWNGQPCLLGLTIPLTSEGLNDPNANRNIQGWSSVISIQASMNFSKAQLAEGLKEK